MFGNFFQRLKSGAGKSPGNNDSNPNSARSLKNKQFSNSKSGYDTARGNDSKVIPELDINSLSDQDLLQKV